MRKLVSFFTIVTFHYSQQRRPPEDLSSTRNLKRNSLGQLHFQTMDFWVCIFATLLLIAPFASHFGMLLTWEERWAWPWLFSIPTSFLFVFILVLFLLLPPSFLPIFILLIFHFILISFLFFKYFFAASFISFSFLYSFYFSLDLDLSLWLVDKICALLRASLRGLEYLEILGRGLFVEEMPGWPSADANLGRGQKGRLWGSKQKSKVYILLQYTCQFHVLLIHIMSFCYGIQITQRKDQKQSMTDQNLTTSILTASWQRPMIAPCHLLLTPPAP